MRPIMTPIMRSRLWADVLFLPIPIITDTSNKQPDYAYGRCISTALPLTKTLTKTCARSFETAAQHVVMNSLEGTLVLNGSEDMNSLLWYLSVRENHNISVVELPLNLGPNAAWRRAQNRDQWQQDTETATLCHWGRLWWWWALGSTVLTSTRRMQYFFVFHTFSNTAAYPFIYPSL